MVDAFPDQLTAAGPTVRMDRQIGAKDFEAAIRAAKAPWSRSSRDRQGCAAAGDPPKLEHCGASKEARCDLVTRSAAFTGCWRAMS